MNLFKPNFRVAHGTTRVVFLMWSWAVKVPSIVEWRLFLCGLLANLQERKFWTMKHPKLCPILWSIPGGWLVVMRRAKPLTRFEFDHLALEDWVHCEDFVVPAEIKQCSFGWINDRLVAVDYG